MSVTVAVLEAKLIATTRDFDHAMDRSESRMKSVAKTAGAAGLAGAVTALGYTLHAGVEEWLRSQTAAAQTEAVLRSTGAVAGVTAKHVDELAKSIMFHTGANVNAVRTSENLLLAFTNVRNEAGKGNDVFDRAIGLIQDYAVRTGRDANQATVIFGKALQDPIKYMGALARAGVVFTQGQKDQIKAMEASGNLLGAQKIVLDSLQQKVGGAADAYGKTLPGQIEIAHQAIALWTGELIAKTVPAISSVISTVKEHWPEIQAAISQTWQTVKPILSALADVFRTVADVVRDHWPTISRNLQTVQTVVQDVAKIITAALKLVVDLIHGDWSKAWDDLKTIVSSSVDAIRTVLKNQLDNVKAAGLALGTAVKNAIEDGITGVGSWVTDRVKDWAGIIASIPGKISDFSTSLFSTFTGFITDAGIGSWISRKIDDFAAFFGALPGRVADAVKDKADDLWTGVKHIFDKLPGFIKDALGISSPSRVFMEIGHEIINGAIAGIENKSSDLLRAAEGAFGSIAHKAGQVVGDVGSAISGALSGGGGAASPGDARAIGKMLAAQFGWSTGAEWNALDALWTQESGWNPLARNPSSGAFGIPQALPASKLPPIAQAGDATSQIMWGLNYIKQRYGDPIRAWGGYWARGGWYHQGGIVPGVGDVPVMAKGGEGIFTRQQMAALGTGGTTYHFSFPNYVGSKQELIDAIRTAKTQIERRGGTF